MEMQNGTQREEIISPGRIYDPSVFSPSVFDGSDFNASYAYDGDDLGSVISDGCTIFRLWAPTALSVFLNLFSSGNGGTAYRSIPMERREKGVWEAREKCGHGTYYTYSVTTTLGTKEAVDPYARAVGVNGKRAMVVDLRLTDPEGFEEDGFVSGITSYSDAIVWETHVRDFSNRIEKSRYRGKYLAFTEHGLTNRDGFPVGLDYLVSLGVTHVQLLPVFDYQSVDEESEGPQFNWGYDPENYNCPEGSYSTDPRHAEVRIREFKMMVQALHRSGIGVVMDVVYNHTYETDSSLNRTVPYYYYRYNSDGTPSNGSGCGNETASERVMFRKFMLDSVTYWAKEYHIDGFRFDLMAIHDLETMQEIERRLHSINPGCLIYGEGWSGGRCALDYHRLSYQPNVRLLNALSGAAGAVAVFNDVMRDGLKGSVFNPGRGGYINANAGREEACRVAFGIRGGSGSPHVSWSVRLGMVVNYMSAHDNNTLWDKLSLVNGEKSLEERIRMNRFGAAILMLSRGIVFFLSGEETMRSKGGEDNSYNSPDSVNNLDWECISEGSEQKRMFLWYRDLIRLRRKYAFIRHSDVNATVWNNNSIYITYGTESGIEGIAIVNPNPQSFLGTLPEGRWKIILEGDILREEKTWAEKCISVPPLGAVLLTR